MYRAAIITASDKGAAGQREDLSGPAIRELLEATGEYTVTRSAVLPDERGELADTMALWCDQGVADVIFTTGGTGFPPGTGPRRPPWTSASGWSPASRRLCGP